MWLSIEMNTSSSAAVLLAGCRLIYSYQTPPPPAGSRTRPSSVRSAGKSGLDESSLAHPYLAGWLVSALAYNIAAATYLFTQPI